MLLMNDLSKPRHDTRVKGSLGYALASLKSICKLSFTKTKVSCKIGTCPTISLEVGTCPTISLEVCPYANSGELLVSHIHSSLWTWKP